MLTNTIIKRPESWYSNPWDRGIEKSTDPFERQWKKRGRKSNLYRYREKRNDISASGLYEKRERGFNDEREKASQKYGVDVKGGMIMGLYEDLQKSLSEAIEIEKGNIPLAQKTDMPADTFIASDRETELINEMVEIRKKQNMSQGQLATMVGSKQQVISRIEQRENSPSVKMFANLIHALGYELKIVKRNG
ncbi:MAG: helix-turn-helix domain-containing protein [Lachnospiraceae bacterium]|nr:helix-turn-helix domain-containing protein [Lachnospiraceae bacterium]